MARGGAVVACRAHNPKVAGSILPPLPTIFCDLHYFKLQSVASATILPFKNATSHQNKSLVEVEVVGSAF